MRCKILFTFILLTGCASPTKPEFTLGNQNYSNESVGIYLVPVWGTDRELMYYLQNTLQSQHKVRVKTTTEMGLDVQHFDQEHQQYIAEHIITSAADVAKSLIKDGRQTPVIVVVPGDMNSGKFRFRYLFSQHNVEKKISAVSLARINPASFGEQPDRALLSSRALKLVNKALGYHLYSYEPSSDLNNVMYGPIMGLEDLDKVSSWYDSRTN